MARERLTTKFAAASDKREKQKPKSPAGEMVRNFEGFEYDPSKAKYLKKALHNINVSLGTMLAAMKELSLLRGSEITPDGMLGGRGFIMTFREIKSLLNQAVGNLSDVTDTLADELTNPRWGLTSEEKQEVKEEQSDIADNADKAKDMADKVDEGAPGVDAPKEEFAPDKLPAEEGEPNISEDIVDPTDVKDSSDVEAIKRYSDLLEGKTSDRVASVLSKNILANISKGA